MPRERGLAIPSFGGSIEQVHEDMKQHRGNMIERMDRMQEEMMKGFGGGSLMKMMGDPFKDDPFFNRGPGFGGDMFERADKMMAEMHRGFDEGAPLAKGHFYK